MARHQRRQPAGRDRTLAAAVEAHRRGDLTRAERIYKDHLRREDSVAEASQFLGLLEHQRGRSARALELLEQATAAAPDDPSILTNLANVLASIDRHAEALDRFEQSIALDANRHEAHHGRSIALRVLGRLEDAEASARRAVELAPRSPDGWNSLAIVRAHAGDPEEAREAYARAIALEPNHAEAIYNLGRLREKAEELDEALECFRRMVELRPSHRGARLRVASCLRRLQRNEEAIAAYRDLLGRFPDYVQAYEGLGITLYKLGRVEDAAAVYEGWLQHDANNATALHLLAACTGVDVPNRAGDDYVTQHFDVFAETFDENLANLRYAVPDAIRDRLDDQLASRGGHVVLDAGCGTGLCAPFLRPRASELVGVDLSPGMLEKANARGLYDALETAELRAYLEQHPGRFDVIVCADTVCYFGEVDALIAAAGRALRPGGTFLFSYERLDHSESPFALNPSGRYAHTEAAIHTAIERAQLNRSSEEQIVARYEAGEPVAGMIVCTTAQEESASQ